MKPPVTRPLGMALGDMRRPVTVFAVAASCGAGAVVGLTNVMTPGDVRAAGVAGALVAYLAATVWAACKVHRDYPHPRLGLCNLVTLSRLVLVAVILAAALQRMTPDPALVLLAVLCLTLDGLDGWLARREGLTSRLGARFDVEVDAAFALTLAAYAALTGVTGPYVLLLGLPYYLFTLAARLWPWLGRDLPERFSRKAVCVAQIAVLIALLVPGAGGLAMDLVVLAIVAALIWSFGRDVRWLFQRRMRA